MFVGEWEFYSTMPKATWGILSHTAVYMAALKLKYLGLIKANLLCWLDNDNVFSPQMPLV